MSKIEAYRSDAVILSALESAVKDGRLPAANLEIVRTSSDRRTLWATAVFAALSRLAMTLPQGWGYALFGWLSQGLGRLLPSVRVKVTQRLRLAFPEATKADLAQIRAKFWRNFGHTFFELLDTYRFMASAFDKIEFEGVEHIEAAKAAGKPLVFVHCHLSNWELMIPASSRLTGGQVSAIYAPMSIAPLNRRLLLRRLDWGLLPFPRGTGNSMRRMMTLGREGTPMLITLDQRVRGVSHPFFGQPAPTTLVPLQVALSLRAHVLPIQLKRLRQTGRFKMVFHGNILPDPAPEKPTEDHALEALTAYNKLLQGWIRDQPEDWFWLHDRWGDMKVKS